MSQLKGSKSHTHEIQEVSQDDTEFSQSITEKTKLVIPMEV